MKYSITAEFWALGKAVNIYVDYLMFYSSRKHMEAFQVQVYIQQ